MTVQYNDQLMPASSNERMYVYMKGNLAPIVIESNIDFAVKYWRKKQKSNPNIYWVIKKNE